MPKSVVHSSGHDDTTQKLRREIGHRLAIAGGIFACMIGACIISIVLFFPLSLRLDEAQSIWQTSHSFGGMLKVVAEDVHVPLYHVILHFWQLCFGQSVVTIRSLSLLFFVLSIPPLYLLARQLLSRSWSMFAVVIYSFSPFMIWYASEARMYTLLALLSIINQLYFTRIVKRNKGWIGYALSAVVGVYSHYFFFFNLMAQAIFYLFQRKNFARGSFKKLVAIAALVIAAISPWLYYFHKLGSGQNTSPHLPVPSTVDFFNAFSQFSFGFQTNAINTILVSSWPLLILIGFFAIRRNQKIPRQVVYIGMAAFVPVVLAYLISIAITPFFLSRYMVSVMAPLIILMVWFVSHYSRRLATITVVIILAAVAFGLYQEAVNPATPVKEDYQAAARIINRDVNPQDVVVLSAPFTVYPFEYYYHGDAKIETLPLWDRTSHGAIPAFDAKKLPDQVASLNKNHTYVYLLLSQDQGYETQISQYYRNHFQRVKAQHLSDDLNLYVYRVGYYTVPSLKDSGL